MRIPRRSPDTSSTFPTMLSPGEARMMQHGHSSSAPPLRTSRRAADLLHEARGRERAGCIPEAMACYESAIAAAEKTREHAVLAEALRRLAVVRYQRDDSARARELCQRSYDVARQIDNDLLAAEALNTLGVLDLKTGSLEGARMNFLRALELGGQSRELWARVEQNLGILANIQGELYEALTRYGRSLEAYRGAGDEHGCAIAYHNLGMVSADRQLYDEADRYFGESLEIAERVGDVYLQALCLVNRAELHVARQRFEDARRDSEAALALYDQLGAQGAKADAYRVIGMLYRETGRLALAESRLRSAIELAVTAGAVLNDAVAVARALGLDELEQTTIRLGAYLHDVGKLRVPHEILNKPGPLTHEEAEVVQMHTVWGIELLAEVEFPWDLKPIIRWHHEKYDDSGYPDRLKGDEIPVSAQIVGIVDVYDALTTTRAYQPGSPPEGALEQITRSRGWWSERVFEAFLKACAQLSGESHRADGVPVVGQSQ